MDFSMDLLNYLSGYHALNNFEEKQANLDSLYNCIIAFENFDVVTDTDPRTNDWRDHLILRTRTQSYSRNHTPIVVETSDTRFWSHDIYERLDAEYDEWLGVDLCAPTPLQFKNTYMLSNPSDAWAIVKHNFTPQKTYDKIRALTK
jgi:hypothetical protein